MASRWRQSGNASRSLPILTAICLRRPAAAIMSPPYSVFECVTEARSLAIEMIESPSPMRESRLVSHTDLQPLRSGDDGYQCAEEADVPAQYHLA